MIKHVSCSGNLFELSVLVKLHETFILFFHIVSQSDKVEIGRNEYQSTMSERRENVSCKVVESEIRLVSSGLAIESMEFLEQRFLDLN